MKITKRDYEAYVAAEEGAHGVGEITHPSLRQMSNLSGLTEEQVLEIRNNREHYRRKFGG